jgi:hypothetical protein
MAVEHTGFTTVFFINKCFSITSSSFMFCVPVFNFQRVVNEAFGRDMVLHWERKRGMEGRDVDRFAPQLRDVMDVVA